MSDVFEDRPDLTPHRERLFRKIEELKWLNFLLLTKRPENMVGLAPKHWESGWPENAWAMTSVENQQYADERIIELLKVRAKVHGLSAEPLLGPIDLQLEGRNFGIELLGEYVNWVIIGGESGPHARPMNIQWARSIISQCKTANVAVFMKQLGAEPGWDSKGGKVPGSYHHYDTASGLHIKRLNDRSGGDPAEWPEDLRVREFPIV